MLIVALILSSLIFILCLYCCFRISSKCERELEEEEKNKVTETEVP